MAATVRRLQAWGTCSALLAVMLTSGAELGPSIAESATVPRIVVREANLDGGVVVRGETVKVNYTVLNEGDAPLRILKAKPG